jgi:cytochrome b involved in lipid metabolism
MNYFSLDEISKHDNKNDCWLVIDGNVYDVTYYIPQHPGGLSILKYAGKDCTKEFHAIHPHLTHILTQLKKGIVAEILT